MRSRDYLRLRQAAEAAVNQDINPNMMSINQSKLPSSTAEANVTTATTTIPKQNSVTNPPPQQYDMQSYQSSSKPFQSELYQTQQSSHLQNQSQTSSANQYQNSPQQSSQYQGQQQYQQQQQYQTLQQQQQQSQVYQTQQYQTQPSQFQQQQQYQPNQSNYQSQSYGSQQSYPGQNLGDQLPQAMVTPPTPLPEMHKMNSDMGNPPNPRSEIRRNSKVLTGDQQLPGFNFQQV